MNEETKDAMYELFEELDCNLSSISDSNFMSYLEDKFENYPDSFEEMLSETKMALSESSEILEKIIKLWFANK